MVALSSALVVVLGLLAGYAYAYFKTTGTGNGKVTIGSLRTLTITATGSPSTVLIPTSTADLVLKITNPNASVTITAISQGTGSVTVTAIKSAAGCHSTNAAVTFNTTATLSTVSPSVVPHGQSTVHITDGAKMGASSATACQNATFTIPVKLKVKS